MAGKKDIVLLNSKGHPVNYHFRYKKIQSAIRKAVHLSVDDGMKVQVWHLGRGQELAIVGPNMAGFYIDTPSKNRFTRAWRHE